MLSLITLQILRPSVEQCLSHSQSVFKPDLGRSESNMTWTHKSIAAKIIPDLKVKIREIDMSAAFDSKKTCPSIDDERDCKKR